MVDYEEIFNDSYWKTTQNIISGNSFFDSFYNRFINSSSEVKEKFKSTDMNNQKMMLKESLVHMTGFYVEKIADEHIQNISEYHNKINIPPHLYDLWLECLIETVKDYDPDFTQEIELSWRLVMATGIVYMKFNYDK
jgi:hemoglobin-like flavoprotein